MRLHAFKTSLSQLLAGEHSKTAFWTRRVLILQRCQSRLVRYIKVAALGGHTVSRSPLAEVFESVIALHAPRGQGSEVSWALWGALAWNVALSNEAAQSISEMNDDIVALLALDADSRGVFPAGALDTTAWNNLVTDTEALKSEHWLLSYEANQQGWLTTPVVAAHPVFSALSTAGVSFYDPLQASPQFPQAGRGVPGGVLPDYYA